MSGLQGVDDCTKKLKWRSLVVIAYAAPFLVGVDVGRCLDSRK